MRLTNRRSRLPRQARLVRGTIRAFLRAAHLNVRRVPHDASPHRSPSGRLAGFRQAGRSGFRDDRESAPPGFGAI